MSFLMQRKALRKIRYFIYVAAILLVVLGTRDFEFVRVLEDDRSTPSAPPGTLLWVSSIENDDGDLRAESLYFLRYPDPVSGNMVARLARLVALPGETISRQLDVLSVGERVLPIPADQVLSWPVEIPPGQCLVLTDNPASSHPDSRQLGTVPVGQLIWRVIIPLRIAM